ncbi:hypothetical protein LTR91_003587 [Friedmanniomyces endolithicus]|uniref:SnoaL-like domain-containing protein n=1 Tax=Friedmanniomyces endolithicus TaxID=329885 RepID=A0AAN6KZ90_9PEZI|nr:hypothetical protein LTR57_015367 [Friedmanniomyces endolithicus]KAK0971663.1 hypothetical protein LTS01_015293 [Friedmanniomyces endolithicus]KAK1006977.1 hypothetical protein LTR91_003587 [Friedmanniomyces endolithicus]KAK1026020.1 hypothetical protein LTS16_022717 [Friedmanniomyces endolithicus]
MIRLNPFDIFAIQNIIALYCLALDTKDFARLHHVFTPDVETIYPFGRKRQGVQSVADAIQKRLAPVSSQHALTTQHILLSPDGQSATATTYFTGIHFGKGKWEGKEVTAWGKYTDTLTFLGEAESELPGASGRWRISRREVTFMGRLGEEGVMDGE